MPLRSGTRIGPYEITALAGVGGMGEVYSARDSRLERTVAIKVLRSGVAAEESYRKRFLREARATAAFSHPGIAAFYEAGEFGDYLYLAMEFVTGHTVQQQLTKGPLSSRLVRDYSLQIAAALEHAHARGIIHRDIKSGNIMITESGAIKLLDFGLAQNIVARDETVTALTAAGAIVGTLHYCAPEVLAGRTATVPSDIYNLGVLMYEMACGCLPFVGLEGASLITAVLRGEAPPVRRRNPTLSEELAEIIGRAMAAQPEQRFRSAAELAAALREMKGRPSAGAVALHRAMPVIAVLEFENLSGDPAMDWLGTGVAETISTDLKKVNSLQVVSRERVQRECASIDDKKDMAALSARLNARWLIAGSYQRAGNRIRITPRLIEPASEVTPPVVAKVDGAWDDIFDLQDRVVSEIMRALEVEMDSAARQRIAAPETLRLEAYEQYAAGRKRLGQFGKDSIEEARRHFERAIELDPDYAVAYSALGHTYAMRWIHRNDPDDLARASGCLERAIELDPEVGEPYAFLCYIYGRQNRVADAIEAGTKAIRHNPDVFYSHYFLGFANWLAGQEISDALLQRAIEHFLNSIQVEAAYSPSWLHVGTIAMNTGAYDRAEQLVLHALELQHAHSAATHLPFAELVLGGIWLRRLEWKKALEWHARALEYLATADNVYREAAMALNACGMTDAHLRQGEIDEALADAHRAWRIVKEFPRMMAQKRILTRTIASLASAYAALGESTRAEQLLKDASAHLETVLANPGSFIHGALTSDVFYTLAVAYLRLGETGTGLGLLAKAVEKGWRDLPWLESDPELGSVRNTGGMEALMQCVRGFPPLHFGARAKAA